MRDAPVKWFPYDIMTKCKTSNSIVPTALSVREAALLRAIRYSNESMFFGEYSPYFLLEFNLM